MKSFVTTAVFISASLLAGVAVAADASFETRKEVVRYSDLDLTRAAGAATLYRRISAAARDVCEPVNSQRWAVNKCVDLALARAVADVDAPALTERYLARAGQRASADVPAALHHDRAAAGAGVGVDSNTR